MKYLFLCCCQLLLPFAAKGQSDNPEITERIIFIADAGDLNKAQTSLIADAASKIIRDKTVVVYLGNNIYPKGLPPGKHKKENAGKEVLASQYAPMRQAGAPVYFIPGTRDWDNSGPGGLENIIAQSNYLAAQNDSLLQMLPPGGCPDPQVIAVSDQIAIIAMDTEWWLFPFDKQNADTSCDCKTPQDVIGRLRMILEQNRGKTILLATHHPFQSYGRRNGNFSWKDNLFPLTRIHPAFLLPLPVAGSFYPLFKKLFPEREDLRHTSYEMMAEAISRVFTNYTNLIHISGHEDGLQLIGGPDSAQLQIVTGIGKKPPFTKKGRHTLFNASDPGYVVIDQLVTRRSAISFYAYRKNTVEKVFGYVKNYQPLSVANNPVYTPITADSVAIAAHASYGNKSRVSRFLFGKNYRRAWQETVTLPVIRLSERDNGLKPTKLGGGFQTISMRLKDADGKEYQLRSVDKTPDRLIPQNILSDVTRKIISDAYSSQHPYSALIVPPIAQAVGVPHAHPEIGVVSPDPVLGAYGTLFAGKVNLLEEREPLRPTDNFVKALKELKKDNDNTYDPINFLKARMLDLLVGDWDRHPDQWRFHDAKKGKGKYYIVVPRDRDQALAVTNGLFETIARYFYLVPPIYGFKNNLLQESNDYLARSSFLEPYPASQINYDTWMKTARRFKEEVTDSVLLAAIAALPKGLDAKDNAKTLSILKVRRDLMPEAMDRYFKFTNRIVDIRTSDKRELVSFRGTRDTLQLLIQKIAKHGSPGEILVSKSYPASRTREIRLYLEKGQDSVFIDNPTAIRLRIIGGETKPGQFKSYQIAGAARKIKIYDYKQEHYYGDTGRLKKHISSDTANLHFVQTRMINTMQPLVTGAINPDDGFMLGLGAKFIRQRGFRKIPYTSTQSILLSHSFSTNAFGFKYSGDWTDVAGKAHFTLEADIRAPENTQNFFGAGNATVLDKTGNFKRFYRTRFDLYTLRPSLQWTGKAGSVFSIGPALQYYHYNSADNAGRFIVNQGLLHTHDSALIAADKLHLGLWAAYQIDRRNSAVLPAYGVYFHVVAQGFAGASQAAKSFVQLTPELAFYKNLNARQTVVVADRIGGAVTAGSPAFYQYAYLGGEGTLLGYRKFRFAGMASLYNNFEMRVTLADFANALFRGKFGILGFYDIGRVWNTGESSSKWHNGAGGGLFVAPAYALVIRFDIGYTPEGVYPSFGFGFRF